MSKDKKQVEMKTVDVFCECCGKNIGRILDRIQSVQVFTCRDCKKENYYNPTTRKSITRDITGRKTSSGYTFI